jgi:hypothetical protein
METKPVIIDQIKHDKFEMGFRLWSYPEGPNDEALLRKFVMTTCKDKSIPGAYASKGVKHACSKGYIPVSGGHIVVKLQWTRHGWVGGIELNPSKLQGTDWAVFRDVLERCLTHGTSGFITSGRVRRAELALDIDGVHRDELYVIDTRVRMVNHDYTARGTTYHGAHCSRRRVVAYDKAKELREEHNVMLPNERTRIEAVLRPKDIPVEQLASLPNPFSSVLVVERDRIATAKGFRFSMFRKHIDDGFECDVAFRRTIKGACTGDKQLFIKELSLQQLKGWDPATAWAAYAKTQCFESL